MRPVSPPGRAPTLGDGAVRLRAHHDDDLPRILERALDPLSVEWTQVPSPYTLEDAKRYVRVFMPGGWETGQEYGFAVEHEGRYAGTVTLRHRAEHRAEVAYASHPDARGTGVMERALRLLLAWGFAERGLEQISWEAMRGNWSSRRLAWKVGFRIEGTLRSHLAQRGVLRDAWVGTLLRGDELTPAQPWFEVPRIEGHLVVLRRSVPTDLPRVVETRNDPTLRRWIGDPLVRTHDLSTDATFLVEHDEKAAAGQSIAWTIADPQTDDYLGMVVLLGLAAGHLPELGYWVHPGARGRGVAREAAWLACRHAFVAVEDGGLGLGRLRAAIDTENTASLRVAGSLGFRRRGDEREAVRHSDGSLGDLAVLDLLAREVSASGP